MKTINDEIAIHDDGFQFYLLLKVKSKINTLIKNLLTIEKCIEYHNECKKESWYNSKTKLYIRDDIEGFSRNSEFTYKEINVLYKEAKAKYDLLIEITEESLSSVQKSYKKEAEWKPPYGEKDRSDILVEHSEIESLY